MKFLIVLAALCGLASAALADDPATFPVGAFTFTRPAAWAWVPVNSPMRKAQLNVPGTEGGKPAEITFFFFGENSGDVAANTKRWLAQFESKADAEKTETMEVTGTKVTLVSTEGTFHSGMPGQPTTPMTDYALLGAILEHPGGSVFVKMTGPAELVKAQHGAFVDFISAAAKSK